jgi:hypothetical protein
VVAGLGGTHRVEPPGLAEVATAERLEPRISGGLLLRPGAGRAEGDEQG